MCMKFDAPLGIKDNHSCIFFGNRLRGGGVAGVHFCISQNLERSSMITYTLHNYVRRLFPFKEDISSPAQVTPSPVYPGLHSHMRIRSPEG